MSQFNIDRDEDGVRITINGQEIDPSQISQRQMRVMINGEELDPSDLSKTKINIKGKRGGGSGCSTCFGCFIGIIIVASIGIGLLTAVAAIFNFNIPGMDQLITGLTGVEVPKTEALNTDPNAFDPFVGLAQAQALAGEGAEIVSISAYYVRSDGTMDLNADYTPAPNVTYEFVRKVDRPADAPPVGVAGSTGGQWYQPIEIDVYKPGSRRHVSVTSGGTRVSYTYTNEGMVREAEDPTSSFSDEIADSPKCTAQQLWSIALENDAPSDAVAIIDYTAEGYTFNISSVVYLQFSSNCKLID